MNKIMNNQTKATTSNKNNKKQIIFTDYNNQ